MESCCHPVCASEDRLITLFEPGGSMSAKEPSRREFLAGASSAALAAVAGTANAQPIASVAGEIDAPTTNFYTPAELLKDVSQLTFSGENATQVAMPLGGI